MSSAPAIAWPTPREISLALVTAARLHGEDPVRTFEGAHAMRGRYIALAVLIEAFPSAPKYALARRCGFRPSSNKASSNLRLARSSWGWWSESNLEAVRAALAAGIAEMDAEIRRIVDQSQAPVYPARLVIPPPRIFDRTIGAQIPDFGARSAFRTELVNVTAALCGDPPSDYHARRAEAEARGREQQSKLRESTEQRVSVP